MSVLLCPFLFVAIKDFANSYFKISFKHHRVATYFSSSHRCSLLSCLFLQLRSLVSFLSVAVAKQHALLGCAPKGGCDPIFISLSETGWPSSARVLFNHWQSFTTMDEVLVIIKILAVHCSPHYVLSICCSCLYSLSAQLKVSKGWLAWQWVYITHVRYLYIRFVLRISWWFLYLNS